MAIRVGGYVTVWEVKDRGNYTDAKVTSSKKNQDGTYTTDYSGFVRFIGEAHKNATPLKEKDRIKIGDFSVTNSYNKEKNITYTNIAVFSFEMADGKPITQTATQKQNAKPTFVADEDPDQSLPF